MKKLVVAGCAALALCGANAGTDASASLTVNQVRQRYPWNGLVDIDYTIECAEGAFGVDDNLEVLMIDNSVTPAATNRAITFLQAPLPMTPGKHRITWDANADGVTKYVENATFSVEIRHYNDTYMVIDVSGGPNASVYPVKFLNAAPVGGFNKDEDKGKYKGSNIVLRCIHPGSYVAGSPADEANRAAWAAGEKQHRVALSQPFYIGIYEITQKQYENVTGAKPSTNKGDYRPVDEVSYDTIRGAAITSNHTYDWPWNGDVAPGSFMGLLRAKCKSKDANGNYAVDVEGFDLPTEFQWEYACRAGTTGAFNTTNEYANTPAGQEAVLKLLGRYKDNQTDNKGGFDVAHTVVGSYQLNQWGLYDMHGNVWEWCLDRYQEDATSLKQFTDPKGAASGSMPRVRRGGGCTVAVEKCRSAFRNQGASASWATGTGFRLSRTLPQTLTAAADWHLQMRGSCSDVRVDLHEGPVRSPTRMEHVLPFAYSSTNWIGGVSGATASSAAKVTIVRLTGTDPDVTKWTADPRKPLRVLHDAAGEGEVKWKPKKGVWKATFDILGTSHHEESFFDLRESRAPGMAVILF